MLWLTRAPYAGLFGGLAWGGRSAQALLEPWFLLALLLRWKGVLGRFAYRHRLGVSVLRTLFRSSLRLAVRW